MHSLQRTALRSGFLGIDSLGWSTLAIVTAATEADRQGAVERLAAQLLTGFGAPDMAAARGKAEEEVAFAASMKAREFEKKQRNIGAVWVGLIMANSGDDEEP